MNDRVARARAAKACGEHETWHLAAVGASPPERTAWAFARALDCSACLTNVLDAAAEPRIADAAMVERCAEAAIKSVEGLTWPAVAPWRRLTKAVLRAAGFEVE